MHTTDLAAGNLLLPNGTFVVELIIFLIVLFVMWRFVVPPIVKAMQERADRVATTAKEQEAATARLAEAETRYETELAEARKKAGDIRAESRAEGQRALAELRAQATEEVEAVRRRGDAEMSAQRERALRELQGHIGELSIALASRIVGAELPATGRSAETVASFMDGLNAREGA
jgi:F-type H+-transporting ATPase subunit b